MPTTTDKLLGINILLHFDITLATDKWIDGSDADSSCEEH
jgi:hypothetical protein